MRNKMAKRLLELSKLSIEINENDPKIRLRPILNDLKSLKATINQCENGEAEKLREIEAINTKIAEINSLVPKLKATIEKGKIGLQQADNLSLKSKLTIQQIVSKSEEAIILNQTKIEKYQEEISQINEEKLKIKAIIKQIKQQYNEKIVLYNKEKNNSDLKQLSLNAKEEALREDITPKILKHYDETAKLIPIKPVVVLSNDICTGCRIEVSRKTSKLVNYSEEIQHCDNCFRILLPENLIN